MKDFTILRLKLQSLTIFRGLLHTTALGKLLALLELVDGNSAKGEKVAAYAEFARELYETCGNWSEYLLNAVLEDENLYMLRFAEEGGVEPEIAECLTSELQALEQAAGLTSGELRAATGYDGYLPEWGNSGLSFAEAYRERMADVSRKGYGVYAKYHTFVLKAGELAPVRHPDGTRLAELSGYEDERRQVAENTLALLEGRPAANILLYGDAGTGKSSTVKAVANEFWERGLRLIELKKSDLRQIPELMDRLSRNPLKFVLFIDDLSFTRDDDDFSALKAVLEGSVAAKTENLVIYATSNRRHLVKETFSAREGDDVHRGDTMQELVSLSERFGLTVTFARPSKREYLRIVAALAALRGLGLPEELLLAQADAYATRRGGYSPRVAKQFVESVQAAR